MERSEKNIVIEILSTAAKAIAGGGGGAISAYGYILKIRSDN